MSQSSEMTKRAEDLIHLGYLNGKVHNEYYTAYVGPGLGMTVAFMVGGVCMVQFFPWTDANPDGHEVYAKFITDKATQVMAKEGELFTKYPFFSDDSGDLLMIKCLIEEGIKQVEALRANHKAS